jgi:glutamate-1-semialdehyde 2,1-aminomutase
MTLGYDRPEIQQAIREQVMEGISFSLPHHQEFVVAERLIEKIPCAEQIRFVKTGSEACAGAARIARMATGRDVVLYGGYHGWHDGYTSSCRVHPGIPEDYRKYNFQFAYNNLFELEEMMNNDVAAIMLEPALIEKPELGYLLGVKDLAKQYGALLIFDEMIMSGRWALAGGQEFFGLTPDLATYGKFLGNGMPLACIAGPAEIMKHAWVVSGTFGGEVLSLAACKEVLNIYEKESPVERQWTMGIALMTGLAEIIRTTKVSAVIEGYAVHPRIRFEDDEDHVQMSILLQELAARGILIHAGGFNISAAMTMEDIAWALEQFDAVFHGGFEKDQLRGLPYRDALRAIP